MSAPSRVVDLVALSRAGGAPWSTLTIPHAWPPVRLIRLRYDRRTRASVALVEFPPRWSRPACGHYLVGEEFVVLRGRLRVGRERYAAHDWAWLPPSLTRGASAAPEGALALAWFSGAVIWRAGPGVAEPREAVRATLSAPAARLGPLRAPMAGVPGDSALWAGPVPVGRCAEREMVWPASWQWAWVSDREEPPRLAGPVLVRWWT
jgi:hypothetical protein